ncbi:MAG: O-antigen ligase family protein [Clostridia bacterium]|nr:O-antigen ligase family protein [Clostridia bacterium]
MGASGSLIKKQPYYLIAYRILLALLWTRYTVLDFIRVIISKIPYIGSLSEIFIPTCIILALIASLPWFAKNVRGTDTLFYVGIVVLYLVTMIAFPDNKEFMTENWWRILIGTSSFYFVGLAYSHNGCSKDLFWCSVAGVFFVFLHQIYKLANGMVLEEDNMYVAYNLLPSTMYLLYYAVCEERKFYWITAFASMGVMFIFGTRGPILCAIVFFVAYFLHRTVTSGKKRNYLLLFVVAVLLIVFCVYDDLLVKIVSFAAKVFERFGFSTRIFDFFISGEVTTSLGRKYLMQETIRAIINNPIKGYGFTGDQYILGIYCHNLFLELWCHFGVIVGSLILLALLGLSLVALVRSARSLKVFYFVLMLISMVYVKLMLSNSYTLEPYFFFMIGAFVAIARKYKRGTRLRGPED